MVYSAYIFFIPFLDWKSLEVVGGSVFMKNTFICLTYELELASFSHRLSHRQLFAYLWSEQYAASILHMIRTNFATYFLQFSSEALNWCAVSHTFKSLPDSDYLSFFRLCSCVYAVFFSLCYSRTGSLLYRRMLTIRETFSKANFQ